MRRAVALLLIICAWATSSAAWAERRVALVIGNGAYQHVTKLPNPPNDAQAIAALLQKAGFEVVSGYDLSRSDMVDRMNQFATTIQAGDTALIFYAGHGIQIDDKNYLVPIDADIHNIREAKTATIDIDIMLDSAAEAKVKLVFLDACRDNPFAEQMAKADAKSRGVANTRGLAAINPQAGMMINFATSPGATALDGEDGHSPFTRALLDNFETPGLDIDPLMKKVRAEVEVTTKDKQVPWVNESLSTEVYLVPAIAPTAPMSTPLISGPGPSSSGVVDNSVENEYWNSIKDSGRREEFEAYLNQYPKGHFSGLAELRIAELEKGGAANPSSAVAPAPQLDLNALKNQNADFASESALALDMTAWRNLQSHLAGAGFLTSGIDGSAGPGTRNAIMNWQTTRQYKVSGFLNKPQMDALLTEPTAAQPQPQTRSAVVTRPTYYNHPRQTGTGVNPGAAIFGTVLGVFACKATHTC